MKGRRLDDNILGDKLGQIRCGCGGLELRRNVYYPLQLDCIAMYWGKKKSKAFGEGSISYVNRYEAELRQLVKKSAFCAIYIEVAKKTF